MNSVQRARQTFRGAMLAVSFVGGALCFAIVLAATRPYYASMLLPVAWMSGRVVDVRPGAVVVGMRGWKLLNCEYLGLVAYGSAGDRAREDGLSISRVALPEKGDTKPTGYYDIGEWLVEPIVDEWRVEVFVRHNCEGRRVQTRIADVDPRVQTP